ncbi:MAG: NADH-ubiquinone oxidoreductase-F iron-sulfur binding region domain-containing protein [Planctomycetia bacterium]
MTSLTVYVPRDAVALAAGADAVAAALAREAHAHDITLRLVRNGSHGMLWLEPLVEVEVHGTRIAYGPVEAKDVPALVKAGLFEGRPHPLCQGPTAKIPYLARQERLVFARVGQHDPLDLGAYEAHGGWKGLDRALALTGAEVVEEVTRSGLRGRGGAGFPTGIKWNAVLTTHASQKYVVANADEGDSGTFSDRMVMEGDPYLLLEGMAIAGVALGATQGYIYLRSEYPEAELILSEALARARTAGILGESVRGSERAFDIELRRGAGSYVCGEETALLESLEGKRGVVRYRPPVPAISGLWGKPTALNNVVSLASVPWILAHGGAAYHARGTGRSRGTLPFQLAGTIKQGGIVEASFGLTLRQLIEGYGGGTLSGRPIRAVQVGGPLGSFLPASALDTPLDYEDLSARGAILGHGGVVAFDDTVDMARLARYAMEFCAIESCGKCTPCRIGSTRGVEVIDRLLAGEQPHEQVALIRDLCEVMAQASLCALGGMAPLPVLSALQHFPEDFHLQPKDVAALGTPRG